MTHTYRRFWPTAVVVLILIGGLALIGSAIYRSGWSQGYAVGLWSAGNEGAALAPYAVPGIHGSPWGIWSGGSALGSLFKIGLIALLVVGVVHFLRIRSWREDGGKAREHWASHWQRHHGPPPPWWQEGPPREASPGEAAPSAEETEDQA